MSEKYKLSLIILHHNDPARLHRLLGSLNQLPAAVEMVIIDDESDDRELYQATGHFEHFRKSNPSAKMFALPWSGVGGARNHGVARCHGEWVWMIDGDDMLYPGALRTALAMIERHRGQDVIVVNYDLVEDDGTVKSAFEIGERVNLDCWDVGVMAWHKLIRREAVLPFRTHCTCEDNDWWAAMCMARRGRPVAIDTGKPVYRYFHRSSGSVTAVVERIRQGEDGGQVRGDLAKTLAALEAKVEPAIKSGMEEAFVNWLKYEVRYFRRLLVREEAAK